MKFTPPGGRVSLNSSNPTATSISIEIANNGIGIHSENLPRIFDPFRSQQGLGSLAHRYGGPRIGLSTTKTLDELHGGSLTASSDGPDLRAHFLIELNTLPPAVSCSHRIFARANELSYLPHGIAPRHASFEPFACMT